MIDQNRLKQLLNYDSLSGQFTWIVTQGPRALSGYITGCKNDNAYNHIKIDGKMYKAHRLAWLYMTGVFPEYEIDHIDGNRSNNQFSNLRIATKKQNQENVKLRIDNKSGYRGVGWDSKHNKWRARISHYGKLIFLGYFDNKEDAAIAAKAARDLLFTHHQTEYSA